MNAPRESKFRCRKCGTECGWEGVVIATEGIAHRDGVDTLCWPMERVNDEPTAGGTRQAPPLPETKASL